MGCHDRLLLHKLYRGRCLLHIRNHQRRAVGHLRRSDQRRNSPRRITGARCLPHGRSVYENSAAYPFIRSSILPSIHPSNLQLIHSSTQPFIHPTTNSFIHPSTHPSNHSVTLQSNHPSCIIPSNHQVIQSSIRVPTISSINSSIHYPFTHWIYSFFYPPIQPTIHLFISPVSISHTCQPSNHSLILTPFH